MERLTHERNNGIKTGYWSPNKKEELVSVLAKYENTGLTPEQICEMDELYREKCRKVTELRKQKQWISTKERLPETETYALISFANRPFPCIGQYKKGIWYLADEDAACISYGLLVNAWMPLPEPYREEE